MLTASTVDQPSMPAVCGLVVEDASVLVNEVENTNLARFDLVSIRLAVYCAELGSLSAAAKRAHCSLSTSSYRLSTLEEAFGQPLFVRDHRGLRTTEAGQLFVQYAKTILQQVDLMNRGIRALSLSAARIAQARPQAAMVNV